MNSWRRRVALTGASLLAASALVLADGAVGAQPGAVPVATRMRNVNLHVGRGIELRIDDLSGRMLSRVPGKPPIFGRPRFVRPGHRRRTATKDVKIRLHPTAMKAAGVFPKRLLDFFGLTLARMITLKPGSPITIDGNDLLFDPERLLPPPRIRGRLTNVTIDKGRLVEYFGNVDSGRHGVAPPDRSASNYMYFRGGTLRFGKLTMDDTDLLLIGADPKSPLDFSPQNYNEQLVAGYSKNTPSHGLIVYMPALNDLARVGTTGGLTPAATGR